MSEHKLLKTAPAVFAVNGSYQIMVPVSEPSVMWVRVGDECFTDDFGGILCSEKTVHRMTVPADKLDSEKKYTICVQPVIERKPRFSSLGDLTELTYSFTPAEKKDGLKGYHISDAHNFSDKVIAAAELYRKLKGEIDFLILNGDLADHLGETENIETMYIIAGVLTGGNIPVVFARGNREVRGLYAEKTAEFLPSDNGLSYYTFRLGNIWGVVLDCGENKGDSHPECAGMAAFHSMRLRETDFLRDIIARADREYLNEGVTHRIAVCHIPFTRKAEPPFNAEEDIYREWISLLDENIRPDLLICAHEHVQSLNRTGGGEDLTHSFPSAVLSKMQISEAGECVSYAGAGLTFNREGIEIIFNDSEKILRTEFIDLKR